MYALWLPMAGFAGIFVLDHSQLRRRVLSVVSAALLLLACSCGGGPSAVSPNGGQQALPQGTYSVLVSGTSAWAQNSTTVTLNIH
jgi:hypothetical protein